MTSLVLLAIIVAVAIAMLMCYRAQVREYEVSERRIAADMKRAAEAEEE